MQVVPIAADGVRTDDGERFQHIAFVEHGARNGAHVHDDVVESALDGAVQIVADRILRSEALEIGLCVEPEHFGFSTVGGAKRPGGVSAAGYRCRCNEEDDCKKGAYFHGSC